MWIEERKNKDGKKVYKFNERYIDQRTLKRKKVSVTYPNKSRETQKTALNWLNDKIDELQSGEPTEIITYRQLVDDWWPIYKKTVKSSTWMSVEFHVKRVSEFINDDTLIDRISTSDINNIFDEISKEYDLSNKYMLMLKNSLNMIFKYAKRKGLVSNNPVEEATIIFTKDNSPKKIKDKFLEDDEYKRIIDYTMKRNKRYGLLFQFLYMTGMRIGEALALNVSDVFINDDGNSYISVTGTLNFRGRKVNELEKTATPKTVAGIRNVALSDKAVEIVRQILDLPPKSEFLFKTKKGTRFYPSVVNAYLIRHREDFKINKKLSSHIFRHTHISKLAEIGVPLYVIQNRVGHESSKMTESIYLHVTERAKEQLIDKLNEL